MSWARLVNPRLVQPHNNNNCLSGPSANALGLRHYHARLSVHQSSELCQSNTGGTELVRSRQSNPDSRSCCELTRSLKSEILVLY